MVTKRIVDIRHERIEIELPIGHAGTLRIDGILTGKPRRKRKASLARALKAARKAGASGATVRPDGSIAVAFTESNNGITNEWDADLGTHSPEIR